MSCFSKRTTDLPASRRRTAAMSPAVPAPASATSTSTAWRVPAARLCGSQAEGRQVAAGVHDCIRDGVPDGDGSGRRARDDINVEIFRLEDSRRHHGGRRRADADGVVASQHANRGEVSVGHNYLGNQLVVVAHGRADPFAVSEDFGDPFLGAGVRHGSLIRWRLLWGGASGQPSDGGGPTESQGPMIKSLRLSFISAFPPFGIVGAATQCLRGVSSFGSMERNRGGRDPENRCISCERYARPYDRKLGIFSNKA